MRIGITLQSLDSTWGGIGIYTKAIVEHLLMLDRSNECFLIYPGFGGACDRLGSYSQAYGYVVEIEMPKPLFTICAYWDQVTIPSMGTKQRTDLHPIRSGPLHSLTSSKKSFLFTASNKICPSGSWVCSEGEV